MNAIVIAIFSQTLILISLFIVGFYWLDRKLGDIKVSVDFQTYQIQELTKAISDLVGSIAMITSRSGATSVNRSPDSLSNRYSPTHKAEKGNGYDEAKE